MSLVPPQKLTNAETATASFARLLKVMDELRENCPWDKKQTLETIRPLTIEETYELADAILDGSPQEIRGELGDLLLHIVFYSRIADERGDFDITAVIDKLIEKLIRRHPHIYGDVNADDEEAVKRNWEQIKLKEKAELGQKVQEKTVLGGVPRGLPAMIKALRIQEKVRAVGFDWADKSGAWDKLQEELGEWQAETDPDKRKAEFGDVMFSLINLARFENIDPEEALELTNRKFMTRFNYVEAQAKAQGKKLEDMTLGEMEALWGEAKKKTLRENFDT